jgi:hypothetical protein
MSVGFYADEHFPGPVIHGLRDRGVDILTALEDGHDGLDDDELLERATELRRLIVTQDQDFFLVAAQRQRMSREFSGVLYLAQGRLSYKHSIDELELIAQCSQWSEWIGQIHSLPIGS